MTSNTELKLRTLYADLMEEAKARFGCINTAVQGRLALPAPVTREFCYLQIRFLCELIALSCLVAHGDMNELKTHKLGRSWSADEIIDKMSKLRPHFYPVAVREKNVTPLKSGKKNHEIEGVNPSPFPKEKLLALYGKTHKFLHRGNLKNLLTAATPLDLNFDGNEIVRLVQPISDLLSHHLIAINENKLIVCLLINPQNDNKVQVVTAERSQG